MKGMELAEAYYKEYGEKMLEENFKEVLDKITIGLVGEGSETFGFDDKNSEDHDFEPGFCLFIDEADEREFGFKLERAYAKLPKEFLGYKRETLGAVGGRRKGVIITEEFYGKLLGSDSAPVENADWLRIPQSYLAVLSAGKIFKEGNGKFDKIRRVILNGYPEDVRKKKIAAHLAFMGQSGQYNYMRSIIRGDNGAAQLAVFEFVTNTIKVCYLLKKKYCPYYKWAFRGMKEWDVFADIVEPLIYLTETGNDKESADCKYGIIEDISSMIIDELAKQGLTDAMCNNLDTHARSVTDKIKDGFLRNMHIMSGV